MSSLLTAQELFERGYYPVSSKYRHVNRIDRADWIEHLAKSLRRSAASFYIPGTDNTDRWGEYYVRVMSKDSLTVEPAEYSALKKLWHGDPCYKAIPTEERGQEYDHAS